MALASPDLAAPPPMVLSIQALDAVVAQPIIPASTPSPATAAITINRQTARPDQQGFSLKAVDTGRASVTQAALSVTFTLTLPAAAKPSG